MSLLPGNFISGFCVVLNISGIVVLTIALIQYDLIIAILPVLMLCTSIICLTNRVNRPFILSTIILNMCFICIFYPITGLVLFGRNIIEMATRSPGIALASAFIIGIHFVNVAIIRQQRLPPIKQGF